MTFVVIACPECGRPRVLEEGPKSTCCPNCARSHSMKTGHVWGRFASIDEARMAIGRINAAAAGEPGAVEAYARLREELEPEPSDAIARACAGARRASGRARKAELIAEGLTNELDEWTLDDFVEAMDRIGIGREPAKAHLDRLVAEGAVLEPSYGSFRAV